MNRMLYQLSYAAIYEAVPHSKRDYTVPCRICQQFFCLSAHFSAKLEKF